MSIQSGARRESWRQSGVRPTKSGGSVRRRQVLTTALLTLFLVAALLLAASILNRRFQHTRVASLLTAAPTKTSEPEQAHTWLPLRFGSESLAPLLAESTQHFQVASLTSSFDNPEDLQRTLRDQIAQLQQNDAFILWIRAKGAEFGGQAYLLSGNYRLPESGEELTSPRGAVPFATIVEAVSQWTGPVLILLDWGNQLCDPRAGVWENQFLSLVVDEIRAAPPQVHCLVSHQSSELSLDSLTSRQTLFGRACAEGMVGPRRLPPGSRSEVWDEDQLLVGDLAEYVIRRVWTDSAQRQKPWLIQGQSGWLSADRRNWSTRTRLPLAKLNQQHRPWGWSELPTTEKPVEAASGAEPAPSALVAGPAVQGAGTELNDENWPTGKLWMMLDQWRTPSPDLGGWSLAAVAPLSAKRMATMVLDLEHRWLAGNDFRGELEGVGLRSRINDLQQSMQQETLQIEHAARLGSFAAVLDGPPKDVPPAEYSNWLQRVESLGAYRQLALILSDAVGLSDNLAKCDGGPNELLQATASAIGNAQTWLQRVTSAGGESIDELRLTDATQLSLAFQSNQSEIEGRLSELVARVARNPQMERPLAEVLSRYCWLSHPQRSSLLSAMNSGESSDPNANSLTMNLESLQASPPIHKEPKRVIAPQRVALIEAAQSREGGRPNISTPAQLVTIMSGVAASLDAASRISEAAVLMVDGRDLCQKESGWLAEQQLPLLPAVPQPQAAWRVAWENADGGQLGSERLQLRSTSEAASVDFMLTRIGAAADIEAVQIQLTGLEGRLRDSSRYQRGLLKLNRQELLRVVDLKANALRVPLELRALSADQLAPRSVQIQVVAGVDSPPLATLACRIPPDTPVVVSVEQLVCRDGITAWEECDRRETLTTIAPFPGRQTQFRMLVSNQDQQSRIATVDLYRLPSRASTHAKGRISEVGGEIPLVLEEQNLRSFTLIATSAPISLEPNAQDKEVDFSPVAATPATANSNTAPPATPASETSTAGGSDIAWGMLAVVRLESEPTRAWRNWIQLRPVAATDFLAARSTVGSDARSIALEVGLKDVNGDQIPDWTPTDFSDDQPIVLDCEIGAGIDLQRATFPMPRQVLTKDKHRQVFSISTERRMEEEVELQVNVDGSVRALFEFVGVGGRAARREPPDRVKLRSIGVKDGLTYLSDFQRNLGVNERYLDSYGAMFQRPVAGPLEIVLAAEAESRNRINALPEQVEFLLVGPTWEHSIGKFWGDRDLVATLTSTPAKTLTIECQLSDWKFTFDPRTLGDVEAAFRGSIGRVQNRELAKLVLDGRGPELARPVRIDPITEGQNGQLVFQVRERVPIGEGIVKIGPEGRELMAEPNGEKLSANDFVPVSDGWQLRNRVLKVQDRPAGRYDVRVELSDLLGNATKLGPWPLVIRSKPEPKGGGGVAGAKPLKGDIDGRLFFGTSKNRPPNEVTVKVKDMPNKTVTSSDGKFKITGLDAGEYTLEATCDYQGAIYKGEAKVKLMTKGDYQKLIDISLSK